MINIYYLIILTFSIISCGITREDCLDELARKRMNCEEKYFSYLLFLNNSDQSDPNFQDNNELRKSIDLYLCDDYQKQQRECENNPISVGEGNNPRSGKKPATIKY